MRRADRLFQIVNALRRRRTATTAAQLAERLGVSERTVYRDVRGITTRPPSFTASASDAVTSVVST